MTSNSEPSYILSGEIPFAPRVPFGRLQAVPPVGVAARRIIEAAAFYGLVAAPQWYTQAVGGGGTLTRQQLQFNIDATEGPLFVVAVNVPSDLEDDLERTLEINIQSGSRTLTEGRVRAFDVFTLPLSLAAEVMPCYIVVNRGDTLIVELSSPSGTPIPAEAGVAILAFVLRSKDGERLAAIADEIATLLRSEGEFYAAGVVDNQNASINISSDVIIQTLLVGRDTGDDVALCTSMGAYIGNYNPFPPQGASDAGLDFGVLRFTDPFEAGVAIQTDIRYPVRAGQRLVLFPRYDPADTDPHADARITIIGRRGPG